MKSLKLNRVLMARTADWAQTEAFKNPLSTKTTQRKENGGYHQPGAKGVAHEDIPKEYWP